MRKVDVVCIGAGPAGLTAGYLLSKNGLRVAVLEADPRYVGGISRTAQYRGFSFDIGGHRFFSKSKEVEALWNEILPNDMLERPRMSRIFYRNHFYSYPLKAFEALFQLGVIESTRCVCSYIWARIFPQRDPKHFEAWVSNQFGKRLFQIFFKTYTEKVWGVRCSEISADWAAQRIKGLSLAKAIFHALIPQKPQKDSTKVIKTLIDSFRYPRKGPGMMWEAAARRISELGGLVQLGARVDGVKYCGQGKGWEVRARNVGDTSEETFVADHVISSAALHDLIPAISPSVRPEAREAATKLKYRDFLTVALIVKDRNTFQDNWIYIHDPSVQVGRIQNFKSWSPEMVPDPSLTCYGLEYFCFEGDGLWTSDDQSLIRLAGKELVALGLAEQADIVDGCVVRQPKAYPVYDDSYAEQVGKIRKELAERYPGLHLVGRNGMHKYNNQDHAMMTAMLTVQNILQGQAIYDVWQVNQDAEYHEAGNVPDASPSTSGLRMVPRVVGI